MRNQRSMSRVRLMLQTGNGPLTFRTIPKPLGFLSFPSCPWACTRARQAPSWAIELSPSKTRVTAVGRSVDMSNLIILFSVEA